MMDTELVRAKLAEAEAAFLYGPASVGLAMDELLRALSATEGRSPEAREAVRVLKEAERASVRRDMLQAREAYSQAVPLLQALSGVKASG